MLESAAMTDDKPFKLHETYLAGEDGKRQPIYPREWYLCGECPSCRWGIPFMHIMRDAPVIPGAFVFTNVPCPRCQARHDYPMADLRKVQAADTPLQ